jgi:hypothetical protein
MQAPFWTADFDAKQVIPGSARSSSGELRTFAYDGLETRDREARLAHVRWIMSQFQKHLCDAPQQMDLSKDAYYELYTLAVSLVRAVALLEPNQPHSRTSEVLVMPQPSCAAVMLLPSWARKCPNPA